MRVAIGADHAGYHLKSKLIEELDRLGHEVSDVGEHDQNPSDYPDSAEAVALAVKEGRADRGIVVGGSGVGASVAANKVPGIRAGVCHDAYSARQGVEHDDMNVLSLGARVVDAVQASELIRAFLNARYTAAPRHRRRLKKIAEIEQRYRQQALNAKGGMP